MKRIDGALESNDNDRVLGWTMRIVGCALALLSVILLTQDIVQGSNATYFFSVTAGLGVLAAISSWMPAAQEHPTHEHVEARYARSIAQ
jgi:hypothetical protein